MAIGWMDPRVNIAPAGLGAWQTVDVSALVPVGTTGVMLRFNNTGITSNIGWRMNGSIDNRTAVVASTVERGAFIGVDAARKLEIYITHVNVLVWLIGYFGTGAVFFVNGINKSTGVINSWQDVDITADVGADTPIAAILEADSGLSNTGVQGIRCKGSADARLKDFARHSGFLVGVDGTNKFQQYNASALYGKLYLVGYLKADAGVSTMVNAPNLPCANTGAWELMAALPAGKAGVFIETLGDMLRADIRANGSGDDAYNVPGHTVWMTGCDVNRLIQGKIQAGSSTTFWAIAYVDGPVPDIPAPLIPEPEQAPWTPAYIQPPMEGEEAQYASFFGGRILDIDLGKRRIWQKFLRR